MRSDRGRLSRNLFSQPASRALVLACSALVGAWILYARSAAVLSVDETLPVAAAVAPPAALAAAAAVTPPRRARHALAKNTYIPLLDPTFSLGLTPVPLAQSAPLGASFVAATKATTVATAELQNVSPVSAPVPMAATPELVQDAPMPPLRPAALVLPENRGPPAASGRRLAQQNGTTVFRATPSNKRTFFEKLFTRSQPSGQALAYAAPEDGLSIGEGRNASAAVVPYGRETAVYNIAAHTVYMPDGTRLEAHSGLGDRLDDPRHVNEKMRGATPPHVYELEPRAQLFHGVRALRLIPVGSGNLFGRTGLLAHTYMLGQKGASFGCVSFKNYNAFLQAYMKGEVKRLVVVAGID